MLAFYSAVGSLASLCIRELTLEREEVGRQGFEQPEYWPPRSYLAIEIFNKFDPHFPDNEIISGSFSRVGAVGLGAKLTTRPCRGYVSKASNALKRKKCRGVWGYLRDLNV